MIMIGLLDICVGSTNIPFSETIQTLLEWENKETKTAIIIWKIRLPMALMAINIGGALGVSGGCMQTILNNPLASPYTLGVSASAGFGAALAIVTGWLSNTVFYRYNSSLLAVVCAMSVSLLICFMSKRRNFSKKSLILSGIALMFLFQSLQSLLQFTGGTGGYIIFLTMDIENGLINKSFILKGLLSRILSLTWCPNHSLLISTSSNGALELWQPFENRKPIQIIRNDNESPIYTAAWSPDGDYLAAAMNRKEIHLYKLVDNELEEIMIFNTLDTKHGGQHTKQILTLSWSPDGKWLVSAGIDKMINVWNVENVNNVKHARSFLSAHYDYVRKIVWNKSSSHFFSCSDDGTVKLWKYNGSNFNEEQFIIVKPGEDNNAILSIAWHPNQNLLAAGLRDDTLALIEYDENYRMKIISCEKYHKGRIWDLCWDNTGRYLFSVGNEGKLKVYQLIDKELKDDTRNELEIKLNCSGLKLFGATGLDILGYQIAENKDMPWDVTEGTLGEFLSSRGAEGYESEYDKMS